MEGNISFLQAFFQQFLLQTSGILPSKVGHIYFEGRESFLQRSDFLTPKVGMPANSPITGPRWKKKRICRHFIDPTTRLVPIAYFKGRCSYSKGRHPYFKGRKGVARVGRLDESGWCDGRFLPLFVAPAPPHSVSEAGSGRCGERPHQAPLPSPDLRATISDLKVPSARQ